MHLKGQLQSPIPSLPRGSHTILQVGYCLLLFVLGSHT